MSLQFDTNVLVFKHRPTVVGDFGKKINLSLYGYWIRWYSSVSYEAFLQTLFNNKMWALEVDIDVLQAVAYK